MNISFLARVRIRARYRVDWYARCYRAVLATFSQDYKGSTQMGGGGGQESIINVGRVLALLN